MLPAMTDIEVEQPDPTGGEPAKESDPKSAWARLPADTRLLLVTVAGTLIANVLTVLVVALAIIVAKKGVSGTLASRWALGGLVACGGIGAVVVAHWLDKRPSLARVVRPRHVRSIVNYLMSILFGALLLVFVYLLAVLGKAAGVR
jgi:hypothetical protein